MVLVAGIDIGNESTEIALAKIEKNNVEFLASHLVPTTGIKGTTQNIKGIVKGINEISQKAKIEPGSIDVIRLNEAAPVIGDVAMETITETIVTESTMIGHDPSTPGGEGMAVGQTIFIDKLDLESNLEELEDNYIVLIPENYDFEDAAAIINKAIESGVAVEGAVVQKDDGVLIWNRLNKKIPIVDEVREIHKVPVDMLAAVEVGSQGSNIKQLCNPYGIATIFSLTPEETKQVVPVAKALIGNRSAVVIRTPKGGVETRVIPAGSMELKGENFDREIQLDAGAKKIMTEVNRVKPLKDVVGESGTNVGGMLDQIRSTMHDLSGVPLEEVKIKDILAVDTAVPQKVKGAVADQFYMENAVALAAMVRTSKLPMKDIADELYKEIGVKVELGGVEAEMAILGSLTTPGVSLPLAILDLGAGSTDAAYYLESKKEKPIIAEHVAGAGRMVTMLIDRELGLKNTDLAEKVKKYPAAKVETLFTIRLEDGTVKFFDDPLPGTLFSRVVVNTPEGFEEVPGAKSIEEVRNVRREAKKKVFEENTIRALEDVIPTGSVRDLNSVVLVGGSSLDFEIPQIITALLSEYGVVSGAANIRGYLGPRNAVATGLVMSFAMEQLEENDWRSLKWNNI
ncbi:diol dehydratase reactivase subunit alpha [Natranaerofaba carboxydovora]|uniref:diol dehydratase reactivase subunit alpha n=1 Tax=Natranaerofaba carboxydovora TaxID=2742683 RepID=UPI001F13CC00|nr:diol dehydratase reactivase subunit alpha [Natranaerofaba carboxydovora]UMZ73460.1 Diol dehydratase-reactivating factor alpha subunit [Natranaerofaba carboxydovora]